MPDFDYFLDCLMTSKNIGGVRLFQGVKASGF